MPYPLEEKAREFRHNADNCEAWALTVSYPDIREQILTVAKQWRDMADRLDQLQLWRRHLSI